VSQLELVLEEIIIDRPETDKIFALIAATVVNRRSKLLKIGTTSPA
jgi:hypothetical protein